MDPVVVGSNPIPRPKQTPLNADPQFIQDRETAARGLIVTAAADPQMMPDLSKLTRLSWSKLSSWEKCREQVLRQSQGHKSPAKNGRDFLPGTVCDRICRRLLEHEDPQPGMMLSWLDEVLDHHANHSEEYVIRWKGGDKRRDYQKVRDVCTKVLTNLEPLLFAMVIPKNYEAEVRFGFKNSPQPIIGVPGPDGVLRPVLLVGGIDILVQDPHNTDWYGVYDLKATENDLYVQGATLAQLTFYAIAIKVLFGVYPQSLGFITPGCSQHFVPVTITQEEIAVMLSRIEAYCHGVWRNDWRPKEEIDSDCTYQCPVSHACSLFQLPPAGQRMTFMELAEMRKKARAGVSG